MKRRRLAGIPFGLALAVGAAIVAVPAIIINSSVSSFSHAQEGALKGEAFYQQRIALPPHSMLLVQLVDTTQVDSPVKIIAETKTETQNQAPFPFSIPVQADTFKEKHNYALQARITLGDALWFVSEKLPISVNELNGFHHIKLEPVSQNNVETIRSTELKGQKWLVEDIFNGGVMDYSHITLLISETPDTTNIDGNKKFNMRGHGGCNPYTSEAIIDETNRKVRFEAPAMTFMACSEAVSKQESRFIDMLTKTRFYEFDDVGRLFFKNAQNEDIGRLVPDN